MIPISFKDLSTLTEGTLYQINDQEAKCLCINSVTINSRNKKIDGLFIALKGKRFDGHIFFEEAISKGAKALLVDRPLSTHFPHIVVNNTRLAMGKLASWVRLQSKAKVIGLTGSCGKTSVKEMLSNILSQRGSVVFTEGNLNNDIGVSLTLFRLQVEHQYAVIEMGTSRVGEIAYITNISKPDSVLINNLFAAHLESLNSLSGVAKAKGEIFQGLEKKGTAIINLASNDWKNWKSYFKEQTIWFFSLTKHQKSNFYAENIVRKLTGSEFKMHTPIGEISISLPLPGIHNITNALAASALAISVGARLEEVSYGLEHVKSIEGRLYPIYLAPGKLILDDTYNANIGSMITAIKVLSDMPGHRILVVGDIKELGRKRNMYHKRIGLLIRGMQINRVFSVGQHSIIISQQSGCGEHFNDKNSLIKKLILLIEEYKIISVLVKGSRTTKMEEVIYALRERFSC